MSQVRKVHRFRRGPATSQGIEGQVVEQRRNSHGFHSFVQQGLVNVPFWEYWTSPKIVAIKKTIYRSWLGDVKHGDMTNDPCSIVFESPGPIHFSRRHHWRWHPFSALRFRQKHCKNLSLVKMMPEAETATTATNHQLLAPKSYNVLPPQCCLLVH